MNQLQSVQIHGTIAIIAILAVNLAHGQAPAPSSEPTGRQKQQDTTPLIPSGKIRGELGKANRRQKLVQEVNRLVVQQNVKDQAIKKLRESYDGTAQMALGIHLLAIEITSDTAAILPSLSATVDDLRAEVAADLRQKNELTALRNGQVSESQQTIDDLGRQILSGNDAEGKPLSEGQLEDLRAALHQRILQRNERKLDAQRYEDDVLVAKNELEDLRKLDRRLDGMAVVAEVYLERLADAVENEREGIVAEEVVEGRKQLQAVVAVIEARAKIQNEAIPATRHNKGERQGVAVGKLSERLKPALTSDEKKIVDDELLKLQQKINEKKTK